MVKTGLVPGVDTVRQGHISNMLSAFVKTLFNSWVCLLIEFCMLAVPQKTAPKIRQKKPQELALHLC